MVGVPQNFTIAYREGGVTVDLFLFSTHTNLMNDYTQAQLDQLALQPKLYVSAAGGKAVVSWPINAGSFVLEAAPSLSQASWSPVQTPAVVAGTRYSLAVTPAGAQYYRLRQP
jgi:hypothetical protein